MISLLFIVFALYFCFLDGHYLGTVIKQAIPVKTEYMNILSKKFTEITRNLFSVLLCCVAIVASAQVQRPKLVVGIVIDQMRWDYLYYYYDKFGEGGMKRLINEGNKERIQEFRGDVIKISGSEDKKRFTVRKMSGNVGVERIFPMDSPFIESITVNKYGKVRRAKLYYLRNLTGKKARIPERIVKK